MAKTFRDWNLDQTMMFPPSLRDLVPEGHLAHFVRDTTVEALDLSAILGEYDEERGYPPYHPAMMTALLLYAYCQGVYSSRLWVFTGRGEAKGGREGYRTEGGQPLGGQC